MQCSVEDQRYLSSTTTKWQFKVQMDNWGRYCSSEHGATFFNDKQPVNLVIATPPLPNIPTQDVQPALSQVGNSTFYRPCHMPRNGEVLELQCQQAVAGLGMNDLCIKYSNQPHISFFVRACWGRVQGSCWCIHCPELFSMLENMATKEIT